ncbi:acetate kinase [Desulfoluna sp.]|uniref:acetate/propionate family kinase n=1 Tax=Desulfoluna sp. TaxID=2045199 RepID=UPI002607D8E0|nr:acetate kinase [Desulfoluna sp.]
MKVLVINAGSSSLKYQLLDMDNEAVMANGIVERIGETVGNLTHKAFPDTDAQKKVVKEEEIKDHKVAMHMVLDLITGTEAGVISDPKEIDAIGHRVVQGGEAFTSACVVDGSVKVAIADNNPLAPLHNPANLMGIEVAEELFPGTPNVAVFDTEFHASMPKEAFLYALPYDYYKELRIRRYGFHGTSHKYVSRKVASLMGKKPEEINVITVHLGNGCSMAAVEKGKCQDTSMGMTPLAGVMMGTRSGDIDPAIVAYIAENKGMSASEVDSLLNKQSGLKGVCGLNDMRDIHSAVENGDEMAKLALDMFAYRVKKYIGAYAAVLGTIDAIVFTAGIGENDDITRALICENLSGLGISMDVEKNKGRKGEPTKIHTDDSKVQVWVIPTNEELQIAQEAVELLK